MKKFKLFKLLALLVVLIASINTAWASTYTVVGNNSTILGAEWSPSTTSNDMTQVSGKYYLYKSQVTLASSGTLEYKVAKDHAWTTTWGGSCNGTNICYGYSSGTKDFIFIFNNESSADVNVAQVSKWTVVGDNSTIFGSTWSPTTTANDMSYSSSKYTKTYSNVTLTCGTTVNWKLACNGSWDFAGFPGSNQSFTIRASGKYNITFEFNPSTLSATATVTPAASHYFIFGDSPLSWTACAATELTGPETDYVGNTYYYYNAAGSLLFKIMEDYNDWDSYSTNERNKNHIDNHVMRTDVDLSAGADNKVSLPSAGYIIYYPSSDKICAATSLTNLGKPYTITYLDQGGGDFSGAHASGYPTTHSYGTATTLKTASKTGYNFVNWFTTSACTGGTNVSSLGATAYEDDITLYAKWTPKTTTLTIKANGGAQSDQTPTATYDSNTVTSFTKVTKAGSGLDGYYTTSDGGVMVLNASGAPVASASDASYTYTDASGNWKYTDPTLTLWAHWLSNVTVTYDANGADDGDVPVDDNEYIPDGAHNATVLGNTGSLVKAGYTWSGWNTLPDGSGASYAASSTISGISSNMTLYAKWVENKETLTPTVDYNGGATPATPYTATSSNTVGVATSTTLTTSAPNAAHYTFAGWTLTNLTVTDGDAATDREIKVKVTTPGSAIAAEAEYNEVLTTSYELRGGSAFGSLPSNPWENVHAMTKKTGHSTESVAYYTASIASTNTGEANVDFQFKIKNGDTWYGIADDGDQWWYTRAISEGGSKTQTLSSTGKNIELRADIAGNYEIKVDYSSTPTITITFPTTYTLTYAIGSIAGNYGSITTSPSTSSGSSVLSGSEITLTAPSAKKGYSWKGWYTNAAGTEGNIPDESRAITVTMNADKTLYACYTEDSYTVTVNASSGGTVSYDGGDAGSSCSASAGVATESATISAIPDEGYAFVGWTNVDADHHITNYSASWNSTNKGWDLTVNADAATTITANFEPRFALVGAINADGNPTGGMPGWALGDAAAFTYSAGTYTITPTLTSSNTNYAFKIIDRRAESWIWRGYTEASNNLPVDNSTTYTLTENGGNNVYFDTRAAGDYTFTVVEETITGVIYPKVKIACPTSYLITSGVKTEYNEGASSDATETGGTYTAVDNSSNDVKGANKYVAASASVTFTAAANTGYTFDAWYTDAACTTGKNTDNPLTVSSISANVTRYAKFKEIMVAIDINTHGYGTISIDDGDPVEETNGSTVPWVKVGVHTTHKVSIASEDEGYYFAGWELSAGSSCVAADKAVNFTISGTASDEDNRTDVIITGLGDPDKCTSLNFLEAKFGELEKIHFRNNFDDGTNPATHWSNVYVYFDVSWNAGEKRAVTSADNSSKNLHVLMTDSEYKNRWWAYVPRYITRNNKYKVAFADFDYAENGYKLWPGSGSSNHGHAVYRDDYRSNNNLFVPYHTPTSTSTADGTGNTDYYNDGYWMLYTIYTGVGGGYYVEERTGSGTYSGRLGELDVINKAWETQKIQYSLRVDGLSHDKFVIFNEAGHKYKASSDITYANCTDVIMTEDNNADAYFNFTPTAEGQYVITIEQEGDQMKMSVEYPVVAGDYVIENAYTDGSAKTTRSNVIKASSASTKTRYSMYLNNAGSGTLKLRKCTGIEDGVPQWSTGDATNLSGILSDGDFTPGVYQFDITVADDKVETIDSVRLYTGNYYIKTDAASGGWAAYKQNAMDKNTVNFDRTSATYDNYMCKYFASRDCNIKSVIANDYCNQLSDTVKLDGIARDVDGEPFVPVDGTSIRFSYNSATNETKRAYLGASERNDFLNIYPSTDNKIYRTVDANEYDLYDIRTSDKGKCKFADNGNWVYVMDLKVYPSGKAGVNATYTDASSVAHVQTLIPDTNTVLGGSSSSTNSYSIRIVYDFKTNFMMSSFILDGSTINEDLSNFDMLWVRHKDEAATQLNLGTGNKLTNVRVVAAIELRYDSVHYNGEGVGHVNLSTWNLLTRPYLKYFVSFPFDVTVNSIFGLNQAKLGTDYIIQGYNGEKRAKEGLFYGDGDSYWEYLTEADTMKAGQGYYVIFDNMYAGGWFGHIWDNKSAHSSVYMYFPAMKEIAKIDNTNQTTTVASHECTIDRAWKDKADKNHMQTDSHWNTVGSPLFHNSWIESRSGTDSLLTAYYYSDYSYNPPQWKLQAIKDAPMFKAMSAILVQWRGTITWTTTEKNIFAAPRKTAEDEKNYLIKLEMSQNGELSDWTYLDLEEGANADFMLNEDVCKVNNRNVPNLYSFAGAYDVAFNALPIENQTIPVGMIIRKNGTYTFSMPYNFSGTVTLIDTYAQTRTNLAIEDYEVELSKGTIDDRFLLEININKVPTAIDNVKDGSSDNHKVYKYIENGNLYIVEDGRTFDARGNRVK